MAPIAADGPRHYPRAAPIPGRWRIFSIGAMIGLSFGAIYVFVPAVTNVIFGKAVHIIPIPWIDLTTMTEAILPAAATGISTNLGLVIVGMVLHHAPSHGREQRIGVVDQRASMFAASLDLAIHDAEPVGHRRAGKKVRIVDEVAAVSEVVHGGFRLQ